MDKIYSFELPLKLKQVEEVEAALKNVKLLTLFDLTPKAHRIITYKAEFVKHGTNSSVLIDFNLFKDILSIGRSADATCKRRKIGAAFIIFCQLADIEIEPCMALHESPSAAEEELRSFRRIDSADIQDLWRVFSGDLNMLNEERLPNIDPSKILKPFPRKIRAYSELELHVLKIADLQLSEGKPIEKLKAYLTWCHYDSAWLVDALIFAILQLTDNCPNPILKHIRSSTFETRANGINNAIRDLLLARHWSKKVHTQQAENCLWILGSRDVTLQRLAQEIHITEGDCRQNKLSRFTTENWGSPNGKRIVNMLNDFQAKSNDVKRKCERANFETHCEEMKLQLQNKLKLST